MKLLINGACAKLNLKQLHHNRLVSICTDESETRQLIHRKRVNAARRRTHSNNCCLLYVHLFK